MKRFKEENGIRKPTKSRLKYMKYATDGPLTNVFITNDNLLLPFHYANLLDAFMSLDLVVNKLICSHEILYINRIEKVLKQMTKGNFNEKTFCQILSVFPESYQYEFDKEFKSVTRNNHRRLQILPNLKFGMTNF